MELEKRFKKGVLDSIADAVSEFAKDMTDVARNAGTAASTVYIDLVGWLNGQINPYFHKSYTNVSGENFSKAYQNWQEALAGPKTYDEVVQDYEAHIRKSYPWDDVLNDLENDNAAPLARNGVRESLADTARLPDGMVDAPEYERLCDEAGIGYAFEQPESSVEDVGYTENDLDEAIADYKLRETFTTAVRDLVDGFEDKGSLYHLKALSILGKADTYDIDSLEDAFLALTDLKDDCDVNVILSELE